MSATDSDNSIDWLASDNESEQELDCTRKHSQTEVPSSPNTPSHQGPSDSSCRRSGEVKEDDSNWSEVREASSRGSPSSCTETWGRDNIGLCKTQLGENMNGKDTRQALKRPHHFTEREHKERQLITNTSEKDRLFTRKVSIPHDSWHCQPQEVVDSVSKN